MTLGINLLLALLWTALIGPFTPANFLVGFIVGYVVLWISSDRIKAPGYARRAKAAVALTVFGIYELIVANLRVAWYTVSSLKRLRPAILAIPLEPGSTDGEITLLGVLITLTPGTLTIDVSPDRSHLYVHFMNVDNPDRAIADIKSGFERMIREVTR